MERIKLQVSASQIQVVQRPAAITAGTVGLEAEFAFDSHWDNLGKTVIFRAGDKVVTAALEGNTHTVPWEVVEKPDLWLIVGVYGANPEGTVVIPTLWTKVAAVYTGVDPEGDPALEPSNPIWQQTLARVANMEPQLSEHIGNTENPHGVTCGQIGAVTQKEFYDAVSNLEGGDSGELIPHLLDKENPHGVTAAQAGAAPAGYGLGDTSSPLISWALTSKDRNGYVRSNNNSPDGDWWYGLNIKYDQTISAQLAFKRVFNNEPPIVAIRHRPSYGETNPWGEWEYVNPPMVEGVEYRTTERFNGKPVYAKFLNFGALPNATSKQIFVANNISNIVRVEGYLDNTGGYLLQTPISNVSALGVYLYNHAELRLTTTSDYSTWDAYIAVYYTLEA